MSELYFEDRVAIQNDFFYQGVIINKTEKKLDNKNHKNLLNYVLYNI